MAGQHVCPRVRPAAEAAAEAPIDILQPPQQIRKFRSPAERQLRGRTASDASYFCELSISRGGGGGGGVLCFQVREI